MSDKDKIKSLLARVEKVTKEKKLDLSSGEDLSVGIMNLIGIEEHLFFTAQKTGKRKYLDLLNEIRIMRVELLKRIIKDYEGEQWCISKHFLAASMRLIEVGTKELKKGNKDDAWDLFTKAYKLYSMFWGLNLNIVEVDNVKMGTEKITYLSEKSEEKGSSSIFDKITSLVQKAINCCKE
jgi:hypothetical protein